jgi:hypothetical protein
MTISQFPIPAGGIPTGDTAGRPANPVIGDVYYNGELGILEIFDGTNFIACSSPPAQPSVVSAVDVGTSRAYGSAQATVTVSDGAGGGSIIDYTAFGTLGASEYSATTTATTITLTVGDSGTYSITAKANNNFGSSISSAATSVALTTVPQAPTIGTATTSGVTSDITVTWTLGSNGGKNLSSITITPYLNGTTAQTSQTAATTSSTTHTFTGLTQGSAYTFKVKATNANGTGLESSATNSVTVPTFITIDYLVVAGGAGGGNGTGGVVDGSGGGAGGLRSTVTASGRGSAVETALNVLSSTNFTVTVGSGGAAAANGSDSVFSSITSTGGGRGDGAVSVNSSTIQNAAGGGCGGGATQGRSAGAGTTGQGYGGNDSGSPRGGGGGTGAQPTTVTGGNGTAVSITGSSVTYGGGGGGSENAGDNSGGTGGGGAGNPGGAGTAGTANTGGGGGGARTSAAGGAGGSGVVILRYLSSRTITVGAGLTADATGTDGSYSYKKFTAGSGNVSWA